MPLRYQRISAAIRINVDSFLKFFLKVYGSTEQELRQLREHHSNSGLLRSGVLTENGKTLMPFATPNTPMDCKRDRTASDIGCFLAGDVRANEQVRLIKRFLKFREL